MDRKPSPVRFPLHSDVSLLAERRRELLCETHQKAPQARRVSLPPGTQRCHPPLPRRHQCKPKALYVDQGPEQNHRRRQARAPSVRFDPLAPKDDTSTEAEIEQHKKAWREAHPRVVSFWYELERKASLATQSPDATFRVKKRVHFER